MSAPRDAYWKSGAGCLALFIALSFDQVIYKMGGNNGQYDPTFTTIPQPKLKMAREASEGNEGKGGSSALSSLEMVCAAVR